MKTKMNLKALASNLLIAVLVLTGCSNLIAQENNAIDLKDFKIVVEKTEDGIKMHSMQGSAWADLSFSLKNDRPHAIDEYGMTDLGKVSSEKDANLADFLFTITETKSGIALKGIEGTWWKDLSFSLAENEKQAIDQFGMTELE